MEGMAMYDDINDFEEIVRCSIHLGIMENPKKLTCQHAFCYDCLKKWKCKENSDDFTCPICRSSEEYNDINKFPLALTENDLISAIMKRRLKARESLSIERKVELNRYEDMLSKAVYQNSSAYETILSIKVENIYKTLDENKINDVKLDFSIFDINILDETEKSYNLVLVDRESNKLIIVSEREPKAFHILVSCEVFKCKFLKIFQNTILMTGYYQFENSKFFVFLQCSMEGKIIRQSKHYLCNDYRNYPMMVGFDINHDLNEYYLCMTMKNKVKTYNKSFSVTNRYKFDKIYPEYISSASHQNKLYISCPRNQKIIIMCLENGKFQTLHTTPLHGLILKTFPVIEEEKIIFLDSLSNKIIRFKILDDNIILLKEIKLDIFKDNISEVIRMQSTSRLALVGESKIVVVQNSNRMSLSD